MFLVIIAAIPIALPAIWSVADSVSSQIQLGGTGLIIVTGVALETVKQINTYLTRREYKGYIRK
jgi:preprotein translocase subunit SecY